VNSRHESICVERSTGRSSLAAERGTSRDTTSGWPGLRVTRVPIRVPAMQVRPRDAGRRAVLSPTVSGLAKVSVCPWTEHQRAPP